MTRAFGIFDTASRLRAVVLASDPVQALGYYCEDQGHALDQLGLGWSARPLERSSVGHDLARRQCTTARVLRDQGGYWLGTDGATA